MREVVMNKKTNLLQLEEHFYQLVDVEEPNVFHNLFPYSEIPKIAFNDRIVPHNMPENIWITDTTFRDGQQSRAPYTTEQIVTIYDYLHKLGGPKGLVRQSEFFLYSKKDRDAVYKCLERGYKFPEVTSWIRASKQDFQLVKDIGLRETGILVSCSDYHIFYKMKMTRREVMNLYLSVIRECLETGISPRCHLEDITRSDIYGFVIPFCVELMKLMDEEELEQLKPVEETKPTPEPETKPETDTEVQEPEPEPEKKPNVLPAILTILLLAGGGGFYAFKKLKGKKEEKAQEKPDPDADYVDDDEDYGYDPEFENDDAEQDDCDCDHQCYDQHCGRYHRVSSFLFLRFLHYYLKPELSGGPPVHGRPPAARIFQNRLPFSSKGRS